MGTTSIGYGPLDIPAPEGSVRPLLMRAELRDGHVLATGSNSSKGRWVRSLHGAHALHELVDDSTEWGPQFALLLDGGHVAIEDQRDSG